MVKRTIKKVVKAIGIFAIMYVALIAILTAASAKLIPNEEDDCCDDYYDEEIAQEE